MEQEGVRGSGGKRRKKQYSTREEERTVKKEPEGGIGGHFMRSETLSPFKPPGRTTTPRYETSNLETKTTKQ